jgi:MFS transporter, DHA2 family, multidrug resistance protein
VTSTAEAKVVPEGTHEWATPISHHPDEALAVEAAAGTGGTVQAAGAAGPATGATTPTTAAAQPGGRVLHRGLITATVVLSSTMQALDNTIANVALPHMQGTLSATQDQMSWVLTSYIVAAVIMTPLSGWLAVRLGRRRVMLYSLIGFTVASALCGLAQTLPEIVAARLLQGLSGAALVPLSQAVLLDINPHERHAKAMAMWAMAITIGPILGPALGAWLTENYTWRWVFFINLPVGALAIAGTMAFVSETRVRRFRFDFFGFATLSLAIGACNCCWTGGRPRTGSRPRRSGSASLLPVSHFTCSSCT